MDIQETQFDCTVCMEMMVEPVVLPCGHTFCFQCIKQSFMTLAETCPLDRKVFKDYKLKVDTKLQQKIKEAEPELFKKQFDMLNKLGRLSHQYFDVTMTYGNKHELVEGVTSKGGKVNRHKWTAFFRFEDPQLEKMKHHLIDKVRFGLHETFAVPHKDVKGDKGPYELSMFGWGTFEVPITVFWKKELGLDA